MFRIGGSFAAAGERDLLVVSLSGFATGAAEGDLRLLLAVAEREREAGILTAFGSVVIGSPTFGIGGSGAFGTEAKSTSCAVGSTIWRSSYTVALGGARLHDD